MLRRRSGVRQEGPGICHQADRVAVRSRPDANGTEIAHQHIAVRNGRIGRGQTNNPRPGGAAGFGAGRRVLDHDATPRVDPEPLCRLKVSLRRRLASRHVVRADKNQRSRQADARDPAARERVAR